MSEIGGHATRRAFLAALARSSAAVAGGATALGAVLGAACAPSTPASGGGGTPGAGASAEPPPSPVPGARAVGLQLYTVRTLMQRDVPGTLRALADIGYTQVEPHDYFGYTPERLRALLDELRLTSPSGHRSWNDLKTDLDGVLDAARVLGQRYVVLPWIEERDRTAAGYRALAADLERFGRAARERGLRMAYHNHDFEFDARVLPGTTPYDLLLAETDPSLVWFELDLFWATKAGRDPVALFERHPGRFPMVHVKDMRGVRGAQEMVEVGAGEIDFARIFAARARAGLEYQFVEHDNPADPLASVRASFATVQRLLA